MNAGSIHFVMRADRLEQNCLVSIVLNQLKDHTKIITSRASPGWSQLALQFVSTQCWLKNIFFHRFERLPQCLAICGALLRHALRTSKKCLSRNQNPLHRLNFLKSAAALAGFSFPVAYSARAAFTVFTISARRFSAMRLRNVSASCSCSSSDSRSAESRTWANPVMARGYRKACVASTFNSALWPSQAPHP